MKKKAKKKVTRASLKKAMKDKIDKEFNAKGFAQKLIDSGRLIIDLV
jgi:hypothetical protein